jgi:phospholipid/cholesterol/gamma-HCH transport system substrate-binding protein
LHNTAEASQQFPALISSLNQSVANLNQATSLAKQGMIPAVQLMNRLDTIAGNVEAFSSDIKENPAVLIRGKQPGHAGPGE